MSVECNCLLWHLAIQRRAVSMSEIVTAVPLGKYLPKEYTKGKEEITIWQKEGLYEKLDHTA